jgi:hypothetical protein
VSPKNFLGFAFPIALRDASPSLTCEGGITLLPKLKLSPTLLCFCDLTSLHVISTLVGQYPCQEISYKFSVNRGNFSRK